MMDAALIPNLDDSEIAQLESRGTRRAVRAGEYLYRAGDTGYDFYVVLSGLVEIVLDVDGEERVIVTHGPGRFLGELNLLTGLRVFVSARVAESGELLAVPAEELRRVLATQEQLSDKILATFMARRNELMEGAGPATRVVGSRFSPEVLQLREFLSRIRIPHEWLDPDADPQVESMVEQFGLEPSDYPVVVSSGTVFRRATPGELADYLGLTVDRLPGRCFDLVIVGGGPSGLAAAVYGASEGLRTLGVDMVAPGGQAGTSSRIENYFGFPTGYFGFRPLPAGSGASREVRCTVDRSLPGSRPERAGRPSRRRALGRLAGGRSSSHRCDRRALPASRRRSDRRVRGQGRLLRRDRTRGALVRRQPSGGGGRGKFGGTGRDLLG